MPLSTMGRQFKRLKTSTTLNSCPETPPTGEVNTAVNNPGGAAGNPGFSNLVAAIQLVVEREINKACAPEGAITLAVKDAKNRAWAEGATTLTVKKAVHASEQRSMARQQNEVVYDGATAVQALLDVHGQILEDFPATYDDFVRMSTVRADSLLVAYGLPAGGTRKAKVKRLSTFCNLNLPA